MRTPGQEARWVLRAQCGDREALELLLGGVRAPLRRYLRDLVGADDVDDVLQDVLVLVFRKLVWLEDPTLFRPWTFRIASRAVGTVKSRLAYGLAALRRQRSGQRRP